MANDAFPKEAALRVADDVVSRVLEGEAVILGLGTETYFGLDPVGTRVWELIEGRASAQEILARLLEEYDVEPQQCERDLLRLLHELQGQGLITVADGHPRQAR
jgi:Coenzyme PQQ synthesis protein D (PqqD)